MPISPLVEVVVEVVAEVADLVIEPVVDGATRRSKIVRWIIYTFAALLLALLGYFLFVPESL